MINRKNVLGKEPEELGIKDAVHTAIVSVRASCPITPGERVGLNQYNEAVPDKKGVGVADPFRRKVILLGQTFWLLLDQDAVPNVQHVWEHEEIKFDPPTREIQRNQTILSFASGFGLEYEQLMDACARVVHTNKTVAYVGPKPAEEVKEAIASDGLYDLWSEWSSETLYEFDNYGSDCCPEWNYPNKLFHYGEETAVSAYRR
jgi:hypothetical protein